MIKRKSLYGQGVTHGATLELSDRLGGGMKHIVMIKIRNVPYRNSTGIITQTLSLMTTRVVYSYYTLKFNACFYFVNFPLKLPRHFRRIRGIIIWHKLHVLTVKSRSLIA